MNLFNYQLEALTKLHTGSILNGGVGSGKSRTSLAYYYMLNNGDLSFLTGGDYIPMDDPPKDLYIITTARKRDTHEWEGELSPFLMSTDPKISVYDHKVVVDSWNNITKYVNIRDAFFIFDEQRVVGGGAWTKSFLKIAKFNDWILLSATPGDTWSDYIPVFIANGFYKNKSEFAEEHIEYVHNPHIHFPMIDHYKNTGRLVRLRNRILVDMDFHRKTIAHHEKVWADYDIGKYKGTIKTRTNPYERGYITANTDPSAEDRLLVGRDIDISDVSPIMPGWDFEPKNGDYVRLVNKPIENPSEFCYTLRKIINSDDSRSVAILEILDKHPKAIIFYNFDYELEILKNLGYPEGTKVSEWNGHKHQEIPKGDSWVYLVQYTSGCEGWNCITTDTIIFYSQNYSYKVMAQACGRIDRLNTPYKDLYYYHLKSHAGIDLSIGRALSNKKKFNEGRFVNSFNKTKQRNV